MVHLYSKSCFDIKVWSVHAVNHALLDVQCTPSLMVPSVLFEVGYICMGVLSKRYRAHSRPQGLVHAVKAFCHRS